MQKIQQLTERLTQLLGFMGVLAILAMMFHIVLDITLRSTTESGVPATEEIVTRYYMVTLALLPLAWVEWHKQMIAVEVFSDLFHGLLGKMLTLFVNLFCIVIYVVFTYSTWLKAVDQYQVGSYVMSLNFPMPVWPTYFVLPLAFALAALVVLIRIPQDLFDKKESDSGR